MALSIYFGIPIAFAPPLGVAAAFLSIKVLSRFISWESEKES